MRAAMDRGVRAEHVPAADDGEPIRIRHAQNRFMILGIGYDITDIRRIEKVIERHGDRFLSRIFTDAERARAERRTKSVETYAKRFAAKEACAKALGTGIRRGVWWRDMGVVNLPSGRPTMLLTGGAAARLASLTPPGHEARIDLSITDEYPAGAGVRDYLRGPVRRRATAANSLNAILRFRLAADMAGGHQADRSWQQARRTAPLKVLAFNCSLKSLRGTGKILDRCVAWAVDGRTGEVRRQRLDRSRGRPQHQAGRDVR